MKREERESPRRATEGESQDSHGQGPLSESRIPPRGSAVNAECIAGAPKAFQQRRPVGQPPLQLKAAHEYRRLGYAVLPVGKDKRPLLSEWKSLQDRIPSDEEVEQWFSNPDTQIAIITGPISGHLHCLDIDDVELARKMREDQVLMAQTPVISTPRGGLHLWVISDQNEKSGPLIEGVADLKADGGYVLVPPSVTDRGAYRVVTKSDPMHVDSSRSWALALLPEYGAKQAPAKREPLYKAALQMGAKIVKGNRNATMTSLAGKLRRSLSLEEGLGILLSRNRDLQPPLPEEEIERIAESVWGYCDIDAGPAPVLVTMTDVARQEVQWLWEPGRIPKGRLTVIDGDPGVGKSWLTLAISAAITTGRPLPGDVRESEPAKVLLLTAEDGLADTVRPRLEDMEADLSRVRVLTAVTDGEGKQRHPSLADDVTALDAALGEGGFALLVIDPINSYLGTTLDTHRDAALRSVLAQVAALAERWGVAVLCIRHLTKGARDRAIYRGQGNIAYVAAARAVHLVGVNPDDPAERVMTCIKNNLAPFPPSLAFEIAEGRFLWRGETSVSAAALLAPDSDDTERRARAEAEDFLRELLAAGPVEAEEVVNQARKAGIAWRTLERTKKPLGVKSRREGFGAGARFLWELSSAPIDRQTPHRPPNSTHKEIWRSMDAPDTSERQEGATVGGLCSRAAPCPHRPPGEADDGWAHGTGGPDPHACRCCGAPVRPDLWTDGLCPPCRNGRPVSSSLVRLALDLGAQEVKP